ncbi:hypothetical protein M427DRAFT_389725 [Gonapodya prolifera JEL478]|uniref:Uncharacterized protein n=1 Tax=Gonapodya prolifera (strain JEL478) TaxID=1344416 RepID=A0A139A8S0_GONPJ|nr:hypothetical protein M427DRAFT_389725 [Gonapodya prolifera JEL478]|eukprot:KXS12855.1 hypothetical protein M427DRAFT_389725 [Gonapodya prolifera JEL478]
MAAQTTAHPPREDFNDDGDAPAKSAVTRALDLIARGKIAMLAVNRCDVGGKARFRALVGSEVAVLRRVLTLHPRRVSAVCSAPISHTSRQ